MVGAAGLEPATFAFKGTANPQVALPCKSQPIPVSLPPYLRVAGVVRPSLSLAEARSCGVTPLRPFRQWKKTNRCSAPAAATARWYPSSLGFLQLTRNRSDPASHERREDWSKRSSQSWDRDRQRVSRLRRMVRPTEPASSEDPWEVAYGALVELKLLRPSVRRGEQLVRLEAIGEVLRRLAWGPSDDEPVGAPGPSRSV